MSKFTTHLGRFWRVVNFVSPCYEKVYSSFGPLLESCKLCFPLLWESLQLIYVSFEGCKLCFPLLWASLQAQKLTKSRILAKTKVYNSKFTNSQIWPKTKFTTPKFTTQSLQILRFGQNQSLQLQSLQFTDILGTCKLCIPLLWGSLQLIWIYFGEL